MSKQFTIRSDRMSASFDAMGAELTGITDASGGEWMTDGDPAVWSGHAPILFPIVGELAGGTYRLNGEAYAMGRHGFARRSAFACTEHEEGGWVRFRLEDSADTRAAYPFAFALEILYEIDGLTVTETATVTNRGDTPMPFSIGFHPGFAWPLPGGGEKTGHRVIFADHEPGPIRRLDEKGLLCAFEDTPVKGRTLRPFGGMFHADAMIWDRLNSRALRFEGERQAPAEGSDDEVSEPAAITLDFPDNEMLGIWQKPGANFLCLEPWSGIADPEGFDGDITDKPGIMMLDPGAARSFRIMIAIHPAQAKDTP